MKRDHRWLLCDASDHSNNIGIEQVTHQHTLRHFRIYRYSLETNFIQLNLVYSRLLKIWVQSLHHIIEEGVIRLDIEPLFAQKFCGFFFKPFPFTPAGPTLLHKIPTISKKPRLFFNECLVSCAHDVSQIFRIYGNTVFVMYFISRS